MGSAIDGSDSPVLSLRGVDVRRFCNGMFTNNVRDLPVGGTQRTALCDAKGKLHGLMDLTLVGEQHIRVRLAGVTAEAFEARYGKYIVFDDVELDDESQLWELISVQGAESADALRAAGWAVPAVGFAVSSGESEVAWHDRCGSGGFDLLVPRGLAFRLDGAAEVSAAEFDRLRVRAGKVRWPLDMPGRYLLHELGLRDEVCSFEKGCYIGQEIIHRVDVMGQIRRSLVGLRAEFDGELPTTLSVEVGGVAVGTATSVMREDPVNAPLTWMALAVLRHPHHVAGVAVDWVDRERRVPAVTVGLPFP